LQSGPRDWRDKPCNGVWRGSGCGNWMFMATLKTSAS
jgi:hypothetical protein